MSKNDSMLARKKYGIVVVAILMLLLGGCASVTSDQTEPDGLTGIRVGYVELPDGRTVLCVSNKQYNAGGLSCDWGGAK